MKENDRYNEDLQKYTTTCKIAERLMELSASGEQVNSDDKEIIEFLTDEEKVNCLKKRLNNPRRINNYLKYITSLDRERDIDSLIMKMKFYKKKNRFNLYRKMAVTASVAAVLVVSFWINQEHFLDKKVSRISEGIKYNIAVPTILFEDGKHLDLVQNIDERIATQENISLVGNGKVKYENANPVENGKQEVKYNTIVVPSKFTWDVELSDGTIVTLNANSSLRFPTGFVGEERQVELNGEAYFRVSKSNKPFVVKVGESSVKVYGTEFNINMNRQGMVQAVLVEGVIGFKSVKNDEVILKPNQMVTLYGNGGNLSVSEVDVKKYLGWKNALFYCEQEPLSTLLDDMASWYGVTFHLNNPSIKDIEVSLTIRREISLIELLSILEDMLKVQFINDGQGNYTIN